MFKAIGNARGVATTKQNIALAKSKYGYGRHDEELLRASQEMYEMRVAQIGEEHEYTIHAGRNYVINLRKANRKTEARELLTKLLATSKQVLGPHHKTTMDVESTLESFNTQHASIDKL